MGLVVVYCARMRNEKGCFVKGTSADNRCPVGTVRVRTRHKRNSEQRAFVKVAEPNVWMLRARIVWQLRHGEIPPGMGIHHKDCNKLNDEISNLELVSKAEHLDEHRSSFDHAARLQNAGDARRKLRWSTKSTTKRTGRPPSWTESELAAALQSVLNGESAYAVGKRTGISRYTLSKKARRVTACSPSRLPSDTTHQESANRHLPDRTGPPC